MQILSQERSRNMYQRLKSAPEVFGLNDRMLSVRSSTMTGTDVDADGTGGEDGDSAVGRRGRLHITGRIGNTRMPDGKLQPMDEGEVVQRVAVSPVQ